MSEICYLSLTSKLYIILILFLQIFNMISQFIVPGAAAFSVASTNATSSTQTPSHQLTRPHRQAKTTAAAPGSTVPESRTMCSLPGMIEKGEKEGKVIASTGNSRGLPDPRKIGFRSWWLRTDPWPSTTSKI